MPGIPPEGVDNSSRALPPIVTSGLSPDSAVERKVSVSASDTASTLLPENSSAVPPYSAEERLALKRAPTAPKPVSIEDVNETPSTVKDYGTDGGPEPDFGVTFPATASLPPRLSGPVHHSYSGKGKDVLSPEFVAYDYMTGPPRPEPGKEILSPESAAYSYMTGRPRLEKEKDVASGSAPHDYMADSSHPELEKDVPSPEPDAYSYMTGRSRPHTENDVLTPEPDTYNHMAGPSRSEKGKEVLSPESVAYARIAGLHWSSKARESLHTRIIHNLLQCQDEEVSVPATLKTKSDLDRLLENEARGRGRAHGSTEPSTQRRTLKKILKAEYNAHIRHHSEADHPSLDKVLSVYFPDKPSALKSGPTGPRGASLPQKVRFQGEGRRNATASTASDITNQNRSGPASSVSGHSLPSHVRLEHGDDYDHPGHIPAGWKEDPIPLSPQSPDDFDEPDYFKRRNNSIVPGDSISQAGYRRHHSREDSTTHSEPRKARYDDEDSHVLPDHGQKSDVTTQQARLKRRMRKIQHQLLTNPRIGEEERRGYMRMLWKLEADQTKLDELIDPRKNTRMPLHVHNDTRYTSEGSETSGSDELSEPDMSENDSDDLESYTRRSTSRRRNPRRLSSQHAPPWYSNRSQFHSGYQTYPGYANYLGYPGYSGYYPQWAPSMPSYQAPYGYPGYLDRHQQQYPQPPSESQKPPPSTTQPDHIKLPDTSGVPSLQPLPGTDNPYATGLDYYGQMTNVPKPKSSQLRSRRTESPYGSDSDVQSRRRRDTSPGGTFYDMGRSHHRHRIGSAKRSGDISDNGSSSSSRGRKTDVSDDDDLIVVTRSDNPRTRTTSLANIGSSKVGSSYGAKRLVSASQRILPQQTAPNVDGDGWVNYFRPAPQNDRQSTRSMPQSSSETLTDLEDIGIQSRSFPNLNIQAGRIKRVKTDMLWSNEPLIEWSVSHTRADLTENSTEICVTALPRDKHRHALFRWIHLPCLSMDDFRKRILELSGLKTTELHAIKNLVERVHKDMKSQRKSRVPVPGTYFSTGTALTSHIQGKGKQAGPDVQWICFPYFSLEAYRGHMANQKRFPIPSLMQHHFSETEKSRDMKQVAAQLDEEKCYHVGQMWCILLDNKFMITSGFSADEFEKLGLVSVEETVLTETMNAAQAQAVRQEPAPRKSLLLVKYSDILQWSFQHDECNTWKRFMSHFLKLYKFNVQFNHGEKVITESAWPEIVGRLETEEKNVVLTLRIGEPMNLISSDNLLPIGDRPIPPVRSLRLPFSTDDPDIQRDTLGDTGEARTAAMPDINVAAPQSHSAFSPDSNVNFHVITWIHDCEGPSKKSILDSWLDVYHETLAFKFNAEDSRRYNYTSTCTLRDLHFNLSRELAMATGRTGAAAHDSGERNKTPLPESETYGLSQRTALFNACLIIFRFFLPIDTDSAMTKRFWKFVEFLTSKEGPMQHYELPGAESDKRDAIFHQITDLARLLSEISLMLRYVNLEAYEPQGELDIAYLYIISALSYTDTRMGSMDRFEIQITQARKYLDIATKKIFVASGQTTHTTLEKFAMVTPEAIMAALMQKLVKNDVVCEPLPDCPLKLADSNIYNMYDAELKKIEREVRQKENTHSYKNLSSDFSKRVDYASQEVLAMEEVVEKQQQIIEQLTNRYKKKAAAVAASGAGGNLGMLISDQDQQALEDGTGEILRPSLLTDRLYEMCKTSITGRTGEIDSFKTLCDMLKTTIEQTHNNRKHRQEQAIFIFTIVTIIFLPLGTLSSIFGMNTADVRSMEQGQWLYWAVSLPITVALMMIGLWMTGDLRQLFKWAMGAMFSKQKRRKLAANKEKEGLELDLTLSEKWLQASTKDVEAQEKANSQRKKLLKHGLFDKRKGWRRQAGDV